MKIGRTQSNWAIVYRKLVKHIDRKKWWHVPPEDRTAYSKRGKFYSSSFQEAEFWGRPLDQPERVSVARPLVGDEEAIEKRLFGKRVSTDDISVGERWALDARMKQAALAEGFDSIVLMTSKAFSEFKASGKLPRSLELNVLNVEQPAPFLSPAFDQVRLASVARFLPGSTGGKHGRAGSRPRGKSRR